MDVESLIRLRVLVCAMGGSAHAKWWRTEFLTAAGLRFLERLYPRTSQAAAVRATVVAAKGLHDVSIGRGGVYHLFRLPEPMERDLRASTKGGLLDTVIGELRTSLETREALLEQLSRLAPELSRSDAGPQRLGTEQDLGNRELVIGRWTGAYFHAFQNDYRVFPYFEAKVQP